MEAFEDKVRRGGATAMQEVERFFMKEGAVHQALRNIAARFDQLGIPYAVAGGMALVGHGYDRTTVDVDILVTPEGLAAIHANLEGLGYVAPFAGSKNLRDTDTGVRIEFLVAGQYPGDGKPKPVAFPDPATIAVDISGVRYVGLPALIELKLASGMTGKGRRKDIGDVQELIRTLGLGEDFAQKLNPYVRGLYIELWRELQNGWPVAGKAAKRNVPAGRDRSRGRPGHSAFD